MPRTPSNLPTINAINMLEERVALWSGRHQKHTALFSFSTTRSSFAGLLYQILALVHFESVISAPEMPPGHFVSRSAQIGASPCGVL